ncbi:MAG TPA: PQQ-dependent sugar dehydrogenase [Rhizomicrobium sp.]|nr:PQQ-dependent sugar dehydrogenase [Rhizomicrobium sp.]
MKKYLVCAVLFAGALGAAFAQPAANPPSAPTELKIPPRKLAAPVPALLQTRAHEIFTTTCAGCHGANLEAGPKGPSLFTKAFLDSHSDEQIVQALASGTGNMPSLKTVLFPNEMEQMPAYLRIVSGNLNRHVGPVPDITGKVIQSQKATFKVETLARGLDQPWGAAFLPDGRMIFTERNGNLRFMDKTGKISEPVKGTPTVFVRQDGGMLDVALPPDYAKTGWIYLSYSTVPPTYQVQPGDDTAPNMAPPTMTHVVRGKVNAKNEWVEQQMLFDPPADSYRNSADHYGSRFLFDGKGHFFWSMGERHDYQMAQNLASPLGKIHRLNEDGTIPIDNPFVHTPGALPSIWSYGHRNPEGLTFDPVSGIFWESEHGPTGGDEINIIKPGRNYGWGIATKGLEPGISRTTATGVTDPITFYNPSIGPAGISFYEGDRYPGWKGSLFLSAMVGQKLIRLDIKDGEIAAQETIFADYGRVRDVLTGPDGLLYVLLQNRNGDPKGGSIIRLVPAK